MTDERGTRVRDVRRRLARDGPVWTREPERDFPTVSLPERDCDLLRDLLIAEGVTSVVEIGLAYGSSALAIGEALTARAGARHVVIDPFQREAYHDVGWDLLREAGLHGSTTLIRKPSSLALPELIDEKFDAAFVDGSHRFHEVFVDFYFLRRIVRPGGLIVLDDYAYPSVRTAVHYYERNLGWTPIDGAGERCRAIRLPGQPFEPAFEDFQPFHA